ncbi:hypothetical protein NNX13_28150, partial [Pseudomonas sp. Eb3]|uniref:hypothetical protein n=1 Tax=Pseudomonas sp. Eb3 TaxID=1327558 RepID=UPI0021051007
KQLSTWVSFQSAEQSLLGQFSVSGNTLDYRMDLAGEKVYLKPKDQPALMLLITQFALSGCQ